MLITALLGKGFTSGKMEVGIKAGCKWAKDTGRGSTIVGRISRNISGSGNMA